MHYLIYGTEPDDFLGGERVQLQEFLFLVKLGCIPKSNNPSLFFPPPAILILKIDTPLILTWDFLPEFEIFK